MATMRFMSTLPGRPSKIFSFDSSPGRAIGQALDAGMWDEKSYQATLMEENVDEFVYEVRMRRAPTEKYPGPHELQVVGIIHHTPTRP